MGEIELGSGVEIEVGRVEEIEVIEEVDVVGMDSRGSPLTNYYYHHWGNHNNRAPSLTCVTLEQY